MTKHVIAGVQPAEYQISEAMVDAGLAAYMGNASHDEMSFVTPRQLVHLILQAAISTDTARSDRHRA
jgi:hypothetical protein